MAQVGCCAGGSRLKGQPAGREEGQTAFELRDPQPQGDWGWETTVCSVVQAQVGDRTPKLTVFLLQSSHLGLPRVPLPDAELGLQGESRVVSAPTVLLVHSIGLKQELQ